MIRTTARTAKRQRFCDGCRGGVYPGDRYLEWVMSPHHDDFGNSGWRRCTECATCAVRYGRASLVQVPA